MRLMEDVPKFLTASQIWEDDPSMSAAEYTTPSFTLEYMDRHFETHKVILRNELYKEQIFEWEEPEYKYGKPTGVMLWKCGTARTLATKLLLMFPSLHHIDGSDSFIILEHGYCRPITTGQLRKIVLEHTTHVLDLSDKTLTAMVKILADLCNRTTSLAHTSEGVPFRNRIFGNGLHAYFQWHSIDYIPNVDKCPSIFLSYINLLVPNPIEREKLFAYLCYLLHESKGVQQNLLLKGVPGTGKSVLMKLIGSCIPCLENLKIDHILKDRASEASMRYVFACLFDEIQGVNLDTGAVDQFKRWATQKTLCVRAGYEKTAINVPWYGRIVLSCNALPYSSYLDKAFFDRTCIIHCCKSFEGDPIADFEEQILVYKNEIWSWIYDNYKDKYVKLLGIRSNLSQVEYNKDVDQFHIFTTRCESSDDYIPVDDIYKIYLEIATDSPLGKTEFTKRLKKINYEFERIWEADWGKKKNCVYLEYHVPDVSYTPEEIEKMLIEINNEE